MTSIRALGLAILALAAPLSLPAAAAAQFGFDDGQKASAELFVRSEGERVLAVLRFEIDEGWHLYHDDLGPPDAIGKPTTIELEAAGVTWGEADFADPERYVQAGLGADGGDTFILGHEELLMVWVEGSLDAGASAPAAADVTARLDGLTCEENGVCIPYRETVTGSGPGPDAFFAAFAIEDEDEDQGDDLDAIFAEGEDDDFGFDPFGDDESKVDATLYVRTADDGTVDLALELEIDDHWHLYHTDLGPPDAIGKPTTLTVEAEGVTFDAPVFPEPKRFEQPGLGADGGDTFIFGHEGRVVVRIAGRLEAGAEAPEPGDVTVTLDGQTCEDDGVCLPYGATVTGRGGGPDELFELASAPAGDGDSGADDAAAADEEDDGLLAFLGLAVFWGLFTLLMPCTYPMIPITISFFTKQAEARGGNVLPLSLAYGAGIVGIFVFIGVVVGGPIIAVATDPLFNLVIGLLFFFFALVLFGALNLNPPRFLMDAAGKASSKGGLIGVFLMGATLVVTSFTCTAPFVGSLLAAGAASGNADVGRIALGMAVFGATMAIPFVLLSLLPGKLSAIPKSGAWMSTLKVALGFVELAAAFKFLSNADLGWQLQLLPRESFLAVWAAIFAVAGAYVLGFIKLKGETGEIGPGRMLAGIFFVMLTGYSAYGVGGRQMDPIMEAIVPPYSNDLVNDLQGVVVDVSGMTGAEGGGAVKSRWHEIVVDDYDLALEQARAADKLLLVNFTGHF